MTMSQPGFADRPITYSSVLPQSHTFHHAHHHVSCTYYHSCSALMIFTLQNHLSETGVSSSGDKGIQMWGTILCKVTVKADCSFPFISFHSRVHDFSLVQTNQKQVALVCHHCFQLTQTLLFL